MNKDVSRRSFLARSAAVASGVMILPRHVLGGPGYRAPSDQLNIAAVGAGGRGQNVLEGASGFNEEDGSTLDNVVALADVDDARAADSFERYSGAKRYRDFRVMLDEMHHSIDAVAISTPDHMHAVAAMAAMQLGKHVYVEKPLTHDVYEARKLTEAARQYGVVTQMGNQGNSGEGIRQVCEWIWSGAIGDVTEVHTWTNRPVWPQGLIRPSETPPVPASLDWDLWLGTAPERPYHPNYLPFSWRGWWDFGTGALGDMACHVVDPAYKALKLGYPSSVEASATVITENWRPIPNHESAPLSSIIHFEFPAREGMPPVRLSWYDGGLMPPRPDELTDGESLSAGGGCLFMGSEGKILCETYGANPTLLPTSRMDDFEAPSQTLPRVEGGTGGHQRVWVEACKGGPACSSNFDYAGPFTEMVLLGNLALRSFMHSEMRTMPNGRSRPVYTGRKKLKWDGDAMRVTNYDPANAFVRRDYRGSWAL
ncbi:MAG: Gfo/Idh/MocA family oxidoreductase [Bacteroidota bacterium]|nr:Gfo/Idh/MocA family oxidoreductase [Bacteroidota bacterium]